MSHLSGHVVHAPSSIPKPQAAQQTPQNMPYQPNQTPSLPPGVLAQEKRILKIDMMGHSWAVIETDFLKDPIFVPPDRANGAADGDTIFVSIKRRPDAKLYARVEKILVKAIPALANSAQIGVASSASPHGSSPSSAYNPHAPLSASHSQPLQPKDATPSSSKLHASAATPKHPPIWVPPSSAAAISHSQPSAYQPSHQFNRAASTPIQGHVQHHSSHNPYAPSSGSRVSSSNPYVKPQAYLPPTTLPTQAQAFKMAPSSHHSPPSAVGYLAAPPQTLKVIEGVLVIDNKSQAYVVPNDSNNVVHIPREFLAGASNGDLVRAHIIPSQSTSDRQVGAVLFRIGVHPSMASSETIPEIKDDAAGSFYPDLEHWTSSHASDMMPSAPPFESPQHIPSVYPQHQPVVGANNGGSSASQQPASSLHPSSPYNHPQQHNASQGSFNPVPQSQQYPIPSSHGAPLAVQAAPSSQPLPQGALPFSRQHSQALPPSASSASIVNRRPSAPSGYGPQSGHVLPTMVPATFINQLRINFNARTKSHPPTLSFAEFVGALDCLGDFDSLSRAFFDAANRAGWKVANGGGGADAINFESFSHFILTFLFSDETSQLRWSFSVLDPVETGYVTRDVIRVQTELVFRLMLNMLLPVYLANPADMAEYMWMLLDENREGHITADQYVESIKKNRNAIIGLGLAQMPSVTPMPIPKRGYPVYPGHPSWTFVLQMMCGLSRSLRAAQESTDFRSSSGSTSAIGPPSNLQQPAAQHMGVSSPTSMGSNLPIQAFRQSNKFELRTVSNQQAKLTFTDYAPAVFRRIRELRGVNDATYLYSLGVEQVLGNFLFGKLTTLAKEGSSGKSGQFFFTSHDGRFLIKTIARHERNTLYKMLPSYLAHLQSYPHSLLVPIYGMHDIDQLTIIVMGNVFNSSYVMDAAWDLKGSVVGRSAPGSFVKKDLDFDRGFVFGASANAELARQIRIDAQYLKSMNIVDYSLIAGYHVLTVDEAAVHDHRDLPPNAHPYFDVGLRSYDPHSGSLKNEVWFLGIIDILIQFGVFKKAENFVKSLVHDPQGISIIPPDQYCERFSNYLVSCIR